VLKKDLDSHLFAEWSESIKDDQVRSAFWYLIGMSACLPEYECRIQWKGEIRDFRFYDDGGEQPFSFITNQKWLLFYFRPPALRSQAYSKDKLSGLFDSFSENTAGEWTIKIQSVADVDRIADYIGLT